MKAFNPYAAPTAAVADAAPASGGAVFFPVGLVKLTLMSLATLGLYEVYWFYKNWKCVHEHSGELMNAPVRAVFYPLTSYWLFRRIREQAGRAQLNAKLHAGILAVMVFLISALWRLPDPWWVVSLLGFLPLLPVQATVNQLNRKLAPHAGSNRGFSGWNIACLIFGGILLVIALLGAFVQE